MIAANWLLLFTLAWAGQYVGNGGNVVVCPGKPPELLDLVEARMLDGATFEASVTEVDAPARVRARLALLARLDPVLAARLAAAFAGYPKGFQFLARADLATVPDSLHVALPKGCRARQAAIRRSAKAEGEARFAVDLGVWKKLSIRGRAALLLHELIYQDFLGGGATDSREARRLNALIEGDGFATLPLLAYLGAVNQLRAFRSRISVGGIEYRLGEGKKLDLYPNGRVRRGLPTGSAVSLDIGGNRYEFSSPNGTLELEFYDTGIPKSGWLNAPTPVRLKGEKLNLEYLIQFAPDGAVTAASQVDAHGKVVGSYAERK